jgi:hypothetical protein
VKEQFIESKATPPWPKRPKPMLIGHVHRRRHPGSVQACTDRPRI